MGNNCCVRSKNVQEVEYGKMFDSIYGGCSALAQQTDFINLQRNSTNYKDKQMLIQIQKFNPANHALPVALHHCLSNQCLGLKASIHEIFKISQNYSSALSNCLFDAKFLLAEYGVLEIQSKGSKCWQSAHLSKQYQIEFQNLKKQIFLSPYNSEIENIICVVRRSKESFAFSFKLNADNILKQKKEYVLHTLYPHIKEQMNLNCPKEKSLSTLFRGYDCGELAFESIDEFYQYLDTLFDEDEDCSLSNRDTKLSSQKSNETTAESLEKQTNCVFIQLIAFVQISRNSIQSVYPKSEYQMMSSSSFVDLLNTQGNDFSDYEEDHAYSNYKQNKENHRFSYLTLKQNIRFSQKSPLKQLDVLQDSQKQNILYDSYIKSKNNIEIIK